MAEWLTKGSLRTRLALAFCAVAVIAVAVLALVVAIESRSETQRVSDADGRRTAGEVAASLARAYREHGSWTGAGVDDAAAIAARADAVLIVRDAGGDVVVGPAGGAGRGPGAGRHASALTVPVEEAGRRVGTAELRFRGGLAREQQRLRNALSEALLVGSAISIVLALLIAAAVSGRIVRPLRRLTSAARRLRAGDLGARAQQSGMPGELGELARAFDAMADAQERDARARTQLVADLSHEVRTPMTILRGNLEELIDGVEEPTPARLASLHEEALRLDGLVEQLDALGRAGVAVPEPDREAVDVAELTAAELEALTPRLTAKRLTVHDDLVSIVVDGDRIKLGQVVANLLSNALKFAPEGGNVDVSVGPLRSDEAALVVADDGPGMSPAERDRAFDRFWRGSAATGVAGRGIGLAVVREIVLAHGGTVTADEGPRGGARLTVRLPRASRRAGPTRP
jgi:two-component system, OmpR family, sensor histidine kinase BaeS